MPVNSSEFPLKLDLASVRHYLPKIHKAVGHDRQLFPVPLPTNKKTDIAKDAGLSSQLDALAKLICNSQFKNVTRSEVLAQKLLKGFIAWLDRCHYKYTSTPSRALVLEPPDRYKKKNWHTEYYSVDNFVGKHYNLFASAGAPIGDCGSTANAFALLMALNGFPCDELFLSNIHPDVGEVLIVFKGAADANAVVVTPALNDSLTSVVTVGGQGSTPTMTQLPVSTVDTPFANHWVVKWRNKHYDANYRYIYNKPADLFDEGASCIMEAETKGFEGRFVQHVKVKARNRVFLQFESKKLLQSFCPSLAGDNAVGVFVMADDPPQQDPVTIGEGRAAVRVSHEVARLFGWCVPDDIASVKKRLMNAVGAYDRTVTGSFFRIASDDSKDFCRRSRKWCGTVDKAPDNRIYSNVDWRGVNAWTVAEARKSIDEALARGTTSTVGKTLYVQLCDAFDFPTALRQSK